MIFTRYPQPGKAKTRLIPALGAEAAADLQRQMTEYSLRQVRKWLALHSTGSAEIWFAGNTDPATDRLLMQRWLGSNWVYQSQPSGDLGTRMATAFQTAFAAGIDRSVIMGTDCPGLDADRLAEAFAALQTHDLVLGGATDGGYYLIGLRQPVADLPVLNLFMGIEWSTAAVLQQTVKIAETLSLSIAYLDPLTDIDHPEDLPVWSQVLAKTPAVSVIIPVLNEANSIQSVLQTIRETGISPKQPEAPEIEIIVVDGGSQDETVPLAEQAGAIVVSTSKGRAKQMNLGAQIATGEVLLFLHADTVLPEGWMMQVQQTLGRSTVVAGAFELSIDGKEWGLRGVEWGVKWRSRLMQLPYGDQAIFLKASTFHQMDGFPQLPIMEDFELIRRLKPLGKIAIAPAAVLTSARRWQKLGILKTTLLNQLIVAAYFLGINPERIARWYRGNSEQD